MEQSTNTFLKGITSDLNPLSTPNEVLTDALNATVITYNGNENILLNDMGNTMIQDSKTGNIMGLREGFVPVGMKEHGGIIYIASVNKDGVGEIGTIPSPVIRYDVGRNTVRPNSTFENIETKKESDLITITDFNLNPYEKFIPIINIDSLKLININYYTVDLLPPSNPDNINYNVISTKEKLGLYKLNLYAKTKDQNIPLSNITNTSINYYLLSDSNIKNSAYWFIPEDIYKDLDVDLMKTETNCFLNYPNIPSGKLAISLEKEGIETFNLHPRTSLFNSEEKICYPILELNETDKTYISNIHSFDYKTNSAVHIDKLKIKVSGDSISTVEQTYSVGNSDLIRLKSIDGNNLEKEDYIWSLIKYDNNYTSDSLFLSKPLLSINLGQDCNKWINLEVLCYNDHFGDDYVIYKYNLTYNPYLIDLCGSYIQNIEFVPHVFGDQSEFVLYRNYKSNNPLIILDSVLSKILLNIPASEESRSEGNFHNRKTINGDYESPTGNDGCSPINFTFEHKYIEIAPSKNVYGYSSYLKLPIIMDSPELVSYVLSNIGFKIKCVLTPYEYEFRYSYPHGAYYPISGKTRNLVAYESELEKGELDKTKIHLLFNFYIWINESNDDINGEWVKIRLGKNNNDIEFVLDKSSNNDEVLIKYHGDNRYGLDFEGDINTEFFTDAGDVDNYTNKYAILTTISNLLNKTTNSIKTKIELTSLNSESFNYFFERNNTYDLSFVLNIQPYFVVKANDSTVITLKVDNTSLCKITPQFDLYANYSDGYKTSKYPIYVDRLETFESYENAKLNVDNIFISPIINSTNYINLDNFDLDLGSVSDSIDGDSLLEDVDTTTISSYDLLDYDTPLIIPVHHTEDKHEHIIYEGILPKNEFYVVLSPYDNLQFKLYKNDTPCCETWGRSIIFKLNNSEIVKIIITDSSLNNTTNNISARAFGLYLINTNLLSILLITKLQEDLDNIYVCLLDLINNSDYGIYLLSIITFNELNRHDYWQKKSVVAHQLYYLKTYNNNLTPTNGYEKVLKKFNTDSAIFVDIDNLVIEPIKFRDVPKVPGHVSIGKDEIIYSKPIDSIIKPNFPIQGEMSSL